MTEVELKLEQVHEEVKRLVRVIQDHQNTISNLEEERDRHLARLWSVPSGVSVILTKEVAGNLHVLVGKRKDTHGAGQWGLPGGRIEPGEDPHDTASRELFEETAIEIHRANFISWQHHPFNSTIAGGEPWLTLFLWSPASSDIEAVLMEPNKCEEWRWALVNKLPEPLFEPLKVMAKESGWVKDG